MEMEIEKDVKNMCEDLKMVMENKDSNFLRLKNVDKVRYFISFNLRSKSFKQMISEINISPKNDAMSEMYRREGNKCFALKMNRDLFKAIELYNKSLCFAENNSDNIGLAYANRSAVFFDWKKYELCLENIDLARKHNYPESLNSKLEKRAIKCKDLLAEIPKNCKKMKYIPKLSYGAHKSVPFIVDCLELNESEEFGRYIKTNKDLKPGDFVAIEDPFCSARTAKFCYLRCSYCLEDNSYSLIPCPGCTSNMFCNEDCYQKAFDNFHKIECNFIDGLKPFLEFDYFCTLRVVLSLFSKTESLTELKRIIEEFDESKINVFTIDHRKTDILERYKAIHTLNPNEEKRSNIVQPCKVAAFIYSLVIRNPIIKKLFEIVEYESLFLELIFRSIQVPKITLGEHVNSAFNVYGEGIYGFCGLLNHSCAPNVSRLHLGKTIVLYVMRHIKKGEQLFDNYGYHHYYHTRDERHDLMKSFCFICECEACTNNYKLVKNLDIREEFNPLIPLKPIEVLCTDDIEYSPNNIKTYCDYLSRYDQYYPCVQLFMVYHALHICFENEARYFNNKYHVDHDAVEEDKNEGKDDLDQTKKDQNVDINQIKDEAIDENVSKDEGTHENVNKVKDANQDKVELLKK